MRDRAISDLEFISSRREQYSSSSQLPAKPYNFPFDNSLHPSNTALLVIDMQRDFCEEGGYLSHQGYPVIASDEMICRIYTLLWYARSLGLTIIYTREGHRPDLSDLSPRELFRSRNNPSGIGIGDKGPLGRLLIRGEPGHEIIPQLAPKEGDVVLDKPGKGAFANTDLDLLLENRQVKNLILCGVTTDVCVHTTMREANDRGFDCLLVEDACAASEDILHHAAVKMVRTEGGIFGTTAKTASVLRTLDNMRCLER